jgi:hypothetical protein
MAEYEIRIGFDRSTGHRLPHDAGLFVRRVSPPLPFVHRIVCDRGGRLRPFTRTQEPGGTTVHTGPVRVGTDFAYLAIWVPPDELALARDFESLVVRARPDPALSFRPSARDASRRRVMATRWSSDAARLRAGRAEFERRASALLGEMGLGDRQAAFPVLDARRQVEDVSHLVDLLGEILLREGGAPFIIGGGDEAGQLREAILARHPSLGSDGVERRRRLEAWQTEAARMLRDYAEATSPARSR